MRKRLFVNYTHDYIRLTSIGLYARDAVIVVPVLGRGHRMISTQMATVILRLIRYFVQIAHLKRRF